MAKSNKSQDNQEKDYLIKSPTTGGSVSVRAKNQADALKKFSAIKAEEAKAEPAPEEEADKTVSK